MALTAEQVRAMARALGNKFGISNTKGNNITMATKTPSNPVVNVPADDTVQGPYLKFLTADGRPPIAGSRYNTNNWPLPVQEADGSWTPGDWTAVEKPVICSSGWHVSTPEGIDAWLNERVFSAMLAGKTDSQTSNGVIDKMCGEQGQLLFEYTSWQDQSTRRTFALEALRLFSDGYARADADVDLLENFMASYAVFIADPTDENFVTVTENGNTLYSYTSGRGGGGYPAYNERKPITSLPVTIGRMVNTIMSSQDLSVESVKSLILHSYEGLVAVSRQDHANTKSGKFTPTMSAEAQANARTVVGQLFVSVLSGNAAVAFSPNFQRRQTVLQVRSLTQGTTAAAEAVRKADAAIEKATADKAKAEATLAANTERLNALNAQLLELHDGDVPATIAFLTSMIR